MPVVLSRHIKQNSQVPHRYLERSVGFGVSKLTTATEKQTYTRALDRKETTFLFNATNRSQ